MMTVKITPNDRGNPPGKLADVELHFLQPEPDPALDAILTAAQGLNLATTNTAAWNTITRALIQLRDRAEPLAGLKLIGFAIWERRTSTGRNVTFPARSYSVNGERRSFALLRPISDTDAQSRIRDLILEAYAEYEEKAAQTA